MKTVEILGYKREKQTKAEMKRLRDEGNVLCVLYGGQDHVQFYAPAIFFRPLVYTPDVAYVNLNIEGNEYKCILADAQYHPVSENILHADFLEIHDGKPLKMNIPVRFHGNAPGMLQGGKLMVKLRYLSIRALPDHMPEFIDIDISNLDLGKSVKVSEIKTDNFEILNSPQVSIASVSIPRAARLEDEAQAAAAATALAEESAEAAAAAAAAEGGAKGKPGEGGARGKEREGKEGKEGKE